MALVLNLTKIGFLIKLDVGTKTFPSSGQLHTGRPDRDQLVTDYRSPHTRSAAFVLPGFRSLDKNLIFQVLVLLGHVLLCLYSSQGCTFLWVSSWSWLGIRTWISYCRSRQASLKVKSVLFTILKLNLIPDAFYWLFIDCWTRLVSTALWFFPPPSFSFRLLL